MRVLAHKHDDRCPRCHAPKYCADCGVCNGCGFEDRMSADRQRELDRSAANCTATLIAQARTTRDDGVPANEAEYLYWWEKLLVGITEAARANPELVVPIRSILVGMLAAASHKTRLLPAGPILEVFDREVLKRPPASC